MRYTILDTTAIPPQPCPCGFTQRAFADQPDAPASLHIVQINHDARTHYHRGMTEIYYFLHGRGEMELDGHRHPVGPGSAVLIRPGCRHRAIGQFKIVNVAIPRFDPGDEYFD
jgi:mannose-6-phosphate isomerase-like protein (cupin superfamily)